VTTSRASAEVPVGEPAEPTTAGQPDGERDGLEHWLYELRTDLSNDPPGWLDSSAARDLPLRGDDSDWLDPHPVEADATRADGWQVDGGRRHVDDPEPTYGDGGMQQQAANAGRHRAPD
jgi:hypothetical protein